ncbi:hypothetical protein CPB85DRAFT_1304635 [Mucidula mucida]|nr:hypothetical protein CPB85DRAFT_1304635 [Mucidula mucida]
MNMNMMCWSQAPAPFFNYSRPGNVPFIDATVVHLIVYTAVTYVVCTAPLVAPKPLPYHSPTFLQFTHLPELDQDLSHPPYTYREPASKAIRTTIKKSRAVPYPHPASRPRKASA